MKDKDIIIYNQNPTMIVDQKVVTLLYQPLIGAEAYTMYQLFCQLADKKAVHKRQFILDMLNMKVREFNQERQKLEAIGLIDLYENEQSYVIEMKVPYSAKQFLVDTVLGTYLNSEIGEQNTNQLIEFFKIQEWDKSSYQQITKTFDDVFEFKRMSLLHVTQNLEHKTIGTQRIKYDFDYSMFIELLPERLKNTQVFDEKFQENVIKVAYVYGYAPRDMATIYQNAYKTRDITLDQLNLQALLYFKKSNQQLKVKEKSKSESDMISTVSPNWIISNFSDEGYQGIALQTTLEIIEMYSEVEIGIINVIIMMLLKHKKGILPTTLYVKKVVDSWLKKGILTTKDATEYAEKIEKARNEYSTNKRVVKAPEWMDEYLKELDEMEG